MRFFVSFFYALFSIYAPLAFANHWDYNADVAVRSFPFGAGVDAELGYNAQVWGEHSPDSADFHYSFLRPVLRLSSAGVVNRGEAMLEFYPISFVRLGAGYALSSRLSDISQIDCSLYACQGTLQGGIVNTRILLGAAGIFGGTQITLSHLAHTEGKIFAEENSSLTGNAPSDDLLYLLFFAGYTLNPTWQFGLSYSTARMMGNDSHHHQESLFFRYQLANSLWNISGGTGLYQSSVVGNSPTFFLSLNWVGVPSMAPR